MGRVSIVMGAAAALLLQGIPSAAQKSTERFIPVGRSPGVSGISSYIGELREVDREGGTVTLGEGRAAHTVKVTGTTRIWLDRSASGEPNAVGGMDDLEPGRRVEVKYVDVEEKATADWIKVVVPDGR